MVPSAIGLLLLLLAWGFYPVAAVQYRESRERTRLAAELESLQARNDRLREQVDKLKTPAGVEDYARSQLGMVKKGENVIVVVDGDEEQESAAALAAPEIDGDETPQSPAGPWTAFLDLVFGVQ
jgi:cell division protein FtsL